MSRHPKEPHLCVVIVDGVEVAAVRAMSLPEARDHFVANHVVVERLSPARAFRLGQRGLLDIECAKPEYQDLPQQGDFGEDGPEWSEVERERLGAQDAEPHQFNTISASTDQKVPHV